MNPAFAMPRAPPQVSRGVASTLTDADIAACLADIQPYETYRLGPVAGSHGQKLQLRIQGANGTDRTCTFETQPQSLLPELVAGVGGEAAHAQLRAFIRSKCDGINCLALYRVRAESRPAIVDLLGTVLGGVLASRVASSGGIGSRRPRRLRHRALH